MRLPPPLAPSPRPQRRPHPLPPARTQLSLPPLRCGPAGRAAAAPLALSPDGLAVARRQHRAFARQSLQALGILPATAGRRPALPRAPTYDKVAYTLALMRLPLAPRATAATALSVAAARGALEALRDQWLTQFTQPSRRRAAVALIDLVAVLEWLHAKAQRRWTHARAAAYEGSLMARFAQEARFTGNSDALQETRDSFVKVGELLDSLAELYTDIAKEVAIVGQSLIYLAGHLHTLHPAVFVLFFASSAAHMVADVVAQREMRRQQSALDKARNQIDSLLLPTLSHGSLDDQRRWRSWSAGQRARQRDLSGRLNLVKLCQTWGKAGAKTAVLVGFGWLGPGPISAARYVEVMTSMAVAQSLFEAALKGPRRWMRFTQLKKKVRDRMDQPRWQEGGDGTFELAQAVKLGAIRPRDALSGQPLSWREVGDRLALGGRGHICLEGPNGSGKTNLIRLMAMAFPDELIWVPARPAFVRGDTPAKAYVRGAHGLPHTGPPDAATDGHLMMARLHTVLAAGRWGVYAVDEGNAHLDGVHAAQYDALLAGLAAGALVIEVRHRRPAPDPRPR